MRSGAAPFNAERRGKMSRLFLPKARNGSRGPFARRVRNHGHALTTYDNHVPLLWFGSRDPRGPYIPERVHHREDHRTDIGLRCSLCRRPSAKRRGRPVVSELLLYLAELACGWVAMHKRGQTAATECDLNFFHREHREPIRGTRRGFLRELCATSVTLLCRKKIPNFRSLHHVEGPSSESMDVEGGHPWAHFSLESRRLPRAPVRLCGVFFHVGAAARKVSTTHGAPPWPGAARNRQFFRLGDVPRPEYGLEVTTTQLFADSRNRRRFP